MLIRTVGRRPLEICEHRFPHIEGLKRQRLLIEMLLTKIGCDLFASGEWEFNTDCNREETRYDLGRQNQCQQCVTPCRAGGDLIRHPGMIVAVNERGSIEEKGQDQDNKEPAYVTLGVTPRDRQLKELNRTERYKKST